MKVISPILTLIAVCVLFFLDDGALFVQLVDRLAPGSPHYLSQ